MISIVTCSYQQGRYLERAMRSVLDQDYPALEYIVIDGGSADGSVEIIKRHAPALAYWVSEPDSGQTDALIKGFEQSHGEICGWLCSDDLLLPGALHAVADYFCANSGVYAAYGDALWIDAVGQFLRPKKEMDFNRFVFLHDHNYVPQPSMFWRRELYARVNGLDPAFDLAMDADLWDRFSTQARIGHIPRYLSCMRFYEAQKTRSRRIEGKREDDVIRGRSHSLAMHSRMSRALVRLLARSVRISSRALAGAYMAKVPDDHLRWLNQCMSRGA
jgi:glycosyltransferase involved in cell wall biosynthesis